MFPTKMFTYCTFLSRDHEFIVFYGDFLSKPRRESSLSRGAALLLNASRGKRCPKKVFWITDFAFCFFFFSSMWGLSRVSMVFRLWNHCKLFKSRTECTLHWENILISKRWGTGIFFLGCDVFDNTNLKLLCFLKLSLELRSLSHAPLRLI